MKRQFGERAICTRCGQDIEWHGKDYGWRDRGNGQGCLPFIVKGEVMKPKGKHTVSERRD